MYVCCTDRVCAAGSIFLRTKQEDEKVDFMMGLQSKTSYLRHQKSLEEFKFSFEFNTV
jgi:hypothetical protein